MFGNIIEALSLLSTFKNKRPQGPVYVGTGRVVLKHGRPLRISERFINRGTGDGVKRAEAREAAQREWQKRFYGGAA